MKKKDENYTPPVIYDDQIVVGKKIARVVIEAIDADMPDAILFKPMCYLAYQNTMDPADPFTYFYYATIVVPEGTPTIDCSIEPINAVNFVTLTIDITGSTNNNVLYFMQISNMPAPIGFPLSGVELKVFGNASTGGTGGVKQGQGTTAVGYQDADEMPASSLTRK